MALPCCYVSGKPSKFEKKMCNTVELMESVLFKPFVSDFGRVFELNEKTSLPNMKCAKYTTDLRFQQRKISAAYIIESRHFFSGKHSLYGFKTKSLVTFTNRALFLHNHVPVRV